MSSAGLLVDPTSHIPIAEGMARVLSDRGIQRQARQAGPGRAAPFPWENTARQVEALLEQLA
ncbi:MAG TPA: hypothetical protein DD643_06985 [Synechococcus sp. UBA8638]|nr:hypothetical protein [Synechococcus sp. UBA8638]